MITRPPPTGEMKLSCFSAVTPVRGWNQWVKWVAPRSRAQVFIASAMSLAADRGRGWPLFRQSRHVCMALWETYCSMVSSLKTMDPNSSGILFFSLIFHTSY